MVNRKTVSWFVSWLTICYRLTAHMLIAQLYKYVTCNMYSVLSSMLLVQVKGVACGSDAD